MDFCYTADQGIYASIILFVGVRFFETRTVLTIAFDKLEAGRMMLRGLDENNVIWIGRRYGTRMEAEAVFGTLQSRLRDSAGST